MPAPIPVLLMVRELNIGGSERQMAEIAKGLDRSRFDPRVGCFRPSGLRVAELRDAGIPVVHFPVPSILSLKGALRIAAYIRDQGVRIVHTFDTPANIYGVPAARLAGTQVVISSQRVDRAIWAPIQRHALRITDRLVDGIVVNCQFLRRRMRDEEKVPSGLLHLCYNGVDTNTFHPARHARPDCLKSASLVVGVVCGLRQEKSLETLLNAFASIREVTPGLRLAIVGSGPCLSSLQDRAQSLGILPDCVFEPATAQVFEWLNAIDVFVLPSRSEALSNSLMEAMACGCCVAASRVGGNPELVTHGKTGMLFEAGDVNGLAGLLRLLVCDPAKRADLGANAARMIRDHFSLQSAAAGMAEIYEELLRS